MSETLLDAPQAAGYLRISRNALYIKCREGRIPHFKVGGQLRFDRDDLRAWLESTRRGPSITPEQWAASSRARQGLAPLISDEETARVVGVVAGSSLAAARSKGAEK